MMLLQHNMRSYPDLRVTLVQTAVHWHSIEANLAMLEEKLWQSEAPTDLIVLPEMFNTGFTNAAPDLAEPMNSRTFRWMRQMAAQTQAAVTGSYIVREKDYFYNRLLWMEPNGSFAHYDKRHLFRMSDEHTMFSAGTERLVQTWRGWRICPLICYDLRFPVWSRNQTNEAGELAYDLLIYVANWPAARSSAWQTLLSARAIENLSYAVGVNRVGTDGNQVVYDGHSAVIDFGGKMLFGEKDTEVVTTQTLSMNALQKFRESFPVHQDADGFSLEGQDL